MTDQPVSHRVYVIPGLGDPNWAIGSLVKRLKKHQDLCQPVVITPERLGWGKDIQTNAHRVLGVIKELQKGYEGKVSIIGHSLGAVIGKNLVDWSLEVESFVSIAGPHQGTKLANLALPFGILKDLKPASYYMSTHDYMPTAERTKVLCLKPQFEELVWPHSSMEIPGADIVTIERTTHLSVLWAFQTYAEIIAHLLWDTNHQVFLE